MTSSNPNHLPRADPQTPSCPGAGLPPMNWCRDTIPCITPVSHRWVLNQTVTEHLEEQSQHVPTLPKASITLREKQIPSKGPSDTVLLSLASAVTTHYSFSPCAGYFGPPLPPTPLTHVCLLPHARHRTSALTSLFPQRSPWLIPTP